MSKKRERVTLAQDFYIEYQRPEDREYVLTRLKESLASLGIYGGGEYDYMGEAQDRAVETKAVPAKLRRRKLT